MIYLICYDIADPKRLHAISENLQNYGIRIQKSFFQCDLEKDALQNLLDILKGIYNKKEDKLFVYPLCKDCLENAIKDGNGTFINTQNFIII